MPRGAPEEAAAPGAYYVNQAKKDFDNGEHYYQLDGSQLWIPNR